MIYCDKDTCKYRSTISRACLASTLEMAEQACFRKWYKEVMNND